MTQENVEDLKNGGFYVEGEDDLESESDDVTELDDEEEDEDVN